MRCSSLGHPGSELESNPFLFPNRLNLYGFCSTKNIQPPDSSRARGKRPKRLLRFGIFCQRQ